MSNPSLNGSLFNSRTRTLCWELESIIGLVNLPYLNIWPVCGGQLG